MEVSEPPIAVTELINSIIDDYILYKSEIESLGVSLDKYLATIRNEVDFNSLITTLNTCYCCERHQNNKPRTLEKYVETTYKNKGNTIHECICKCRQLSRFICRSEYGYLYEPELYEQSEPLCYECDKETISEEDIL